VNYHTKEWNEIIRLAKKIEKETREAVKRKEFCPYCYQDIKEAVNIITEISFHMLSLEKMNEHVLKHGIKTLETMRKIAVFLDRMRIINLLSKIASKKIVLKLLSKL
jgi:diadenosine tetraphosphate (Ap4A) HIT family hydrolase